jgi:hypothetical protein
VRELSAVALRLRAVREAELHFLGLWATEEALVWPGLDRVAASLDAAESSAGSEIWPHFFHGPPPGADEYLRDVD